MEAQYASCAASLLRNELQVLLVILLLNSVLNPNTLICQVVLLSPAAVLHGMLAETPTLHYMHHALASPAAVSGPTSVMP